MERSGLCGSGPPIWPSARSEVFYCHCGMGNGPKRCNTPATLLGQFLFLWPGNHHCAKSPLVWQSRFVSFPDCPQGRSTVITFLGIEIDSVRQELCLPASKLARLQALIVKWSQKRSVAKHQLLGHLNHAARPGLRNLIDTMSGVVHLDSRWASIQWWSMFLDMWNGYCSSPVTPAVHQTRQAHGDVVPSVHQVNGSKSSGLAHGIK